jgi:diguanylate cyclase (GGDEF)-like protein
LSGKFLQPDDGDTTQEITVPVGVRPKRTALVLQVVKGPRVGEVFTVEHSHAVLGRGNEADLRIVDPSLSRMHARFDRDGDTLAITDLDSRNGSFVDGQRLHDRRRLKNGDLIMLGNVVLRFAHHDAEELQLSRDLYEAAVRDRLTRLHNRGYFDDRLSAEFAYHRRHGGALAVLLVDLDHFKQVNDTHGHAAGDSVLQATAEAIRESLRAEDVAARYGGEEFVVLARGTDSDGALALGERLRARIAQREINVGTGVLRVTASIGVAVMRKDAAFRTPAELLVAADTALYASKHAGRNRVSLHRETGRPPERVDTSYAVHSSGDVERIRSRPKRGES